jgi:hypothetical protein
MIGRGGEALPYVPRNALVFSDPFRRYAQNSAYAAVNASIMIEQYLDSPVEVPLAELLTDICLPLEQAHDSDDQ